MEEEEEDELMSKDDMPTPEVRLFSPFIHPAVALLSDNLIPLSAHLKSGLCSLFFFRPKHERLRIAQQRRRNKMKAAEGCLAAKGKEMDKVQVCTLTVSSLPCRPSSEVL